MTADLAKNVRKIYERYAIEWDADRNSNPWNDKRWIVRFVEALPCGAAVLDLGYGSGEPVARHLAASGLHITGVDTSPTLISLCRKRLPDHEWVVSDMRTVMLGKRFKGVLAWDSYFFLEPDDQRHMFEVFAAHAAPGAVLIFNTGPVFGEAIGSYRGEPLYHASLDAAEYKRLLNEYGFEVVAHTVEDQKAGGRTAWLARARPPLPLG
jgi:trans-aconitate methyltransferase